MMSPDLVRALHAAMRLQKLLADHFITDLAVTDIPRDAIEQMRAAHGVLGAYLDHLENP